MPDSPFFSIQLDDCANIANCVSDDGARAMMGRHNGPVKQVQARFPPQLFGSTVSFITRLCWAEDAWELLTVWDDVNLIKSRAMNDFSILCNDKGVHSQQLLLSRGKVLPTFFSEQNNSPLMKYTVWRTVTRLQFWHIKDLYHLFSKFNSYAWVDHTVERQQKWGRGTALCRKGSHSNTLKTPDLHEKRGLYC